MKVSNHAVRRYLERESDIALTRGTPRGDNAALHHLEREFKVDVEAARRQIGQVFQTPRLERLSAWANGAPFRLKIDRRVYCCRADTVTTFYWNPAKARRSSTARGGGKRSRRTGKSRYRPW